MVQFYRYRFVAACLVAAGLCYWTPRASAQQPASPQTVLLDFWLPTCGPCRQMDPHIQQLQREGFPVRKIDGSRQAQFAQQFGVNRYPTLVMISDGRVVRKAQGYHSYQQLRQLLASGGVTAPLGRAPMANTRPAPRQRADSGVVPATFAGPAPAPEAAYQVGSDLGPAAPAITIPGVQADPREVADQARQRQGAASQVASAGGPNPNQLLSASVRIKVRDASGSSFGTGTIIDSRQGEALVLTCAHLFRDGSKQVSTSGISVELFQPAAGGVRVVGNVAAQVLSYDFERDVALVSIRPPGAVEVARVAASPSAAVVGGQVWSVGCDQGANPTVRVGRINTIDRYQSPPSLTASGAPVVGRSGGGLFDASGELVGVCYGADAQGDEGFYAKLISIHAELDKLGLTEIYRGGSQPLASLASTTPPPAASPAPLASQPADDGLLQVRPSNSPAASRPPLVRGQNEFPAAQAMANLTANERAALEELSQRAAQSEVVCVVRPKRPGGKSEVITLDEVSPQFLQALRSMPARQ